MNDPISMYVTVPMGTSTVQSTYNISDAIELLLNDVNGALTLKSMGNIPNFIEAINFTNDSVFSVGETGRVNMRELRVTPYDTENTRIIMYGIEDEGVSEVFRVNPTGRVSARSLLLYGGSSTLALLDSDGDQTMLLEGNGSITSRMLTVAPSSNFSESIYNVFAIKDTTATITALFKSSGECLMRKLGVMHPGAVVNTGIGFKIDGDDIAGFYLNDTGNICMSNGGNNVFSTNNVAVGFADRVSIGSASNPLSEARATVTADTFTSLRCTSTLEESLHKVVIDAYNSIVGIELGTGMDRYANITLDANSSMLMFNPGQIATSGPNSQVENAALLIDQNKVIYSLGRPMGVGSALTTDSSSILYGINVTIDAANGDIKIKRNIDVHTITITATWHTATGAIDGRLACALVPALIAMPTAISASMPVETITGVCYVKCVETGDRYLCGWEVQPSGVVQIYILENTSSFAASLTWQVVGLVITYTV